MPGASAPAVAGRLFVKARGWQVEFQFGLGTLQTVLVLACDLAVSIVSPNEADLINLKPEITTLGSTWLEPTLPDKLGQKPKP